MILGVFDGLNVLNGGNLRVCFNIRLNKWYKLSFWLYSLQSFRRCDMMEAKTWPQEWRNGYFKKP